MNCYKPFENRLRFCKGKYTLTGRPCKVDSIDIENGRSDLFYKDKAINHGESFTLFCDKNYFKSGSKFRTCVDGSISPSFEEDPFTCFEGGLVTKFSYSIMTNSF